MAGHSKWANIKRRKSAVDAKRGALFTKLVKDIVTAAKQGGGNIDANPSLRLAVKKARDNSMPMENIQRAIDKATGNLKGVTYEDITYEGYGPHGVAILMEVMTDNRNRTVSNIRSILRKAGGNLGESGSVSWMFEKKGVIVVEKGKKDDEVLETAMEGEAEEILDDLDDVIVIETDPANLNSLLNELEKLDVNILESKVEMVATNQIELGDEERESVEKLIEKLEDDDDIQNIYTNLK
ncbi:MAG TPA: YebC/PmpR family DNA-binding transcriptional regulator [Campylobacterales bacterium]|nr:YebC/PmpR family DNA-binding transcriptional regulator [Campylobacterales bacterium]HIO71438.1 YebC/PmpR family DNA-binding transcriptional regulator [Campylobacterales bacterium]